MKRRFSVGAEMYPNGVHFRLWAPKHQKVNLIINEKDAYPMEKEKGGYFSLFIPNIGEGTLYFFELSGNGKFLADPASRFQPRGPLGPSEVINPKYNWKDSHWQGCRVQNQIIYEMHIGTF